MVEHNEHVILVVDDNPVNLRVLCKLLETHGYHPHPCISGPLALKEAVRLKPSLILLDIRMPEIDGYQVCSQLKENSATAQIPVIFISAAGERQDIVQGFEVGGVDYVAKPFDAPVVLARVKTHVNLFKSQQELAIANNSLREIKEGLESTVTQRTQELKQSNIQLKDSIEEKERLNSILQEVAIGISQTSGKSFFADLTKLLTRSVQVDFTIVSKRVSLESNHFYPIGLHGKDKTLSDWEYPFNQICEQVLSSSSSVLLGEKALSELGLSAKLLPLSHPKGYACLPIRGVSGEIEGLLEVITSSSMIPEEEYLSLFELFALRASSELQRIDAENKLLRSNEELERLVQGRTQELRTVNRELESFSYTVSHDLRAPLRAMEGFSEALIEDYDSLIDEQGKTYLSYIIDGSREMRELIDGLLSLARSTRGELNKESIDLSQMVMSLVSDLEVEFKGCTPEVVIDTDIRVIADRVMIQSVLKNLLSNAWKYSKKEGDAKIHVGAVDVQSLPVVIYIADNGVGFDESQKAKLFKPFQRLHKAQDFEGSGIGLATVKRIIDRHGGVISACSKPREGTVFYFTLESVNSSEEFTQLNILDELRNLNA